MTICFRCKKEMKSAYVSMVTEYCDDGETNIFVGENGYVQLMVECTNCIYKHFVYIPIEKIINKIGK